MIAAQNLDEGLKNFDYSLLSAARDRLLQDLLTRRHHRNKRNILLNNLIADDELDYVAAAGGELFMAKALPTKDNW